MAAAVAAFGSTVQRVRVALSTFAAAVLGLAPHVLHHVGPLAGAALLGGIGGSLVFGAAGFALSLPLLLRVRRRCGNWRIPALLLVTFASAFSISTFVVGPAITDADDAPAPALQAPAQERRDGALHEAHHR
jgi:hypothetical protein